MSSGWWTDKTMLTDWAVERASASLTHVAFFVKKDASDLVPFAAVASFFAAAEIGFSALRCDQQGNQVDRKGQQRSEPERHGQHEEEAGQHTNEKTKPEQKPRRTEGNAAGSSLWAGLGAVRRHVRVDRPCCPRWAALQPAC